MTKLTGVCSVCQKELGTSYCTGCGVYFCTKDFKYHRGMLFNEMNTLTSHRNDLQYRINKAIEHIHTESPLFVEIDEWQQMMIEKIKVVAEHTRQQVADLLNSKRTRLNNEFERFSQELFHLKQTENFVEHDINRLKYMMHELNHELKQIKNPPTIVLHTELSERLIWSRLIYAQEKSTYGGIGQRDQHVKDEQQLAALYAIEQPPENYLFSMISLIDVFN